MKQIKLFKPFLMVALCVLIASCNKEDNDDFKNSKPLVKITNSFNFGGNDGDFTFRYSDGKLIKVIDENKKEINITYTGKTVTVKGSYIGEFTLQLNNDGFAESGIWTYLYGDTHELDFEYSKGNLTKYTLYSSNDNIRKTVNIKYDNGGNLSNASVLYSEGGKNYTWEYTFTSSDYPSKGKSWFFFGDDNCLEQELWSVYYAGLLGKHPQNLISKIECKGNTPSSLNNNFVSQTFDYSFYDDGYVKKITGTEESHWGIEYINTSYFYE